MPKITFTKCYRTSNPKKEYKKLLKELNKILIKLEEIHKKLKHMENK